MDPLCHTLVGATLGCTGLEKKTRYSRFTLIAAANLPDIDAVAYFMGGTASYAFRRGITHGLPALIVLPILLTLVVLSWDRFRNSRNFRSDSQHSPVSAGWLLVLSLIGVWSHPALDWLNNYGMRWLMPIVNEWFYGDTLFIMDWIIWLTLLTGLVASHHRFSIGRDWYGRPASWSLGALLAYIAFNANTSNLAERTALRELHNNRPLRLMTSPVPFNPLRRELVFEYPDHYRFADYTLGGSPALSVRTRIVEKGDANDLRLVDGTRDGQWFLHWARFPYSVSRVTDGQRIITAADARYVSDLDNPRLDGFAVFELNLPIEAGDAGASR